MLYLIIYIYIYIIIKTQQMYSKNRSRLAKSTFGGEYITK